MGGPEPLPEGMMTMRHLSDELVRVRVRVRVRDDNEAFVR